MNRPTVNTPTEETLFLVSGGGKGITAQSVIALAEAYQCGFLLVGRSALLEREPAWARGVEGEGELKRAAIQAKGHQGEKPTPREINRHIKQVLSSREIQRTLDAVASQGGRAKYVSADITRPAELREALDGDMDQVTGILHGAGALADKYIQDKVEGDFDLVYGVKVDGLQNMLDLVSPERLQFLILFSSVAGFYGNAGQADYALGNEVLNKYAHYLHHTYPDCQVLAINWGPWDGGMVTPQLKRILTRRDVDLIPIDEGTDILVELISSHRDGPQWVVGNPLPRPSSPVGPTLRTHRVTRRLSLEANPFLQDHVIGGRAVLPTVCAVGWFIHTCEGLYPGYTFFEAEDYRVFKGILFDDTLADEYVMELEETVKNEDTITFQGLISSRNEKGLERKQYQANITLKRALPEPPRLDDFNLEPGSQIPGEALYENNTLFHGPSFQGVKEVLDHSRQGLTTRCNLPALPAGEQGQFPAGFFNPYLTDAHLQSLLIWASEYKGVQGLPLRISRGRQYQPLRFDTTSYVTMTVNSVSDHNLNANVISHDQEGRVISEVMGAEITLSERLNELFQQNQLRERP